MVTPDLSAVKFLPDEVGLVSTLNPEYQRINTISKLIDLIVTRRISFITKIHQLLLSTHIRGRKGRLVGYTLYTIVEKIYEAWKSPET